MAFVEGIHGSATRTGVLIEYRVSSVEGGFTRPEIRHYVLEEGKLKRVEPVALTPHYFTAFWLQQPWAERSRWTADASRARLEAWSKSNQGPFAEFGLPSRHCTLAPDLWQVSTTVNDNSERPVYFVMRWRPPFHFTMISAGDRPRVDCTEEDREADATWSVFPDR